MIDINLGKDTCFSVYDERNPLISLSFIVFFEVLRGFKGDKSHFFKENAIFLKKKWRNIWCELKKLYLCIVKQKMTHTRFSFGLWCNGNTTDSGPVFPGSSPGSPTTKH